MTKKNRPQKITDYFKIRPDNISKQEKKFLAIVSVVMFIVIASFVNYQLAEKKGRQQIEDGYNYKNCVFEVVGYRSKFNSTVFKYTVSGKRYNYRFHNTSGLQINEKYAGRYNISRPEICLVYLTKPLVDTTDFKKGKGKILNTGILKNKKWIELQYKVDNKNFKRQQYLEDLQDIQVGEFVEILYNINNPNISYVNK